MAVFGLDPARWFVIHLLAFAASAIAFYAAVRLFFPVVPSVVAASLYVAAVPSCSLMTELGGIHYVLAIFFGSLAAITYVMALRRGSAVAAATSALIYLVAMLAKETVVPLVVFFLFLPERDLRIRARMLAGHVLALIVYLVWRRSVIGTLLGGYGWAVAPEEWPALIVTLPLKVALAMAGVHVLLGVLLILVMGIGVALAVRSRRAIMLFLVALALALGPIIPVSKEMQRRYAIMPWLCWSIAFVAGAQLLEEKNRKVAWTLFGIVPLLAIVVNRQEWGSVFGRTHRMSEEARFFVEAPPEAVVRAPIVPPAAMGEFNWLKTIHLRKPGGASWFYDDLFLCAPGVNGKRVWEFSPRRRAMTEITSSIGSIARRHCRSIRDRAPLFAEFQYRNAALFWRFGPYDRGRYRVLLGNGVQAFDVPRIDGFRLPEMSGLILRIRYDSPEGWVTYSPDLALDFVRKPVSRWER
jgi:hypothetical protein